MSKTTPEEARALALKHGILFFPVPVAEFKEKLAALIDEVRGVDAEPVAWARYSELGFINGNHAMSIPLNCKRDEFHGFVAPLYTHPAPSQPAAPLHETALDFMQMLLGDCSDLKAGEGEKLALEWSKKFHEYKRLAESASGQPAAPVELPVISWDVVTGKPLVFLSDAQAAIAAGRKAS